MLNLSETRPRCIALILLSASICPAGFAHRAEANFEVTNLGSNNSFSTASGFNVTGPKTFPGQGYGIAVRFTVASSTSISFDSAELGLVYRGGTNSINIALMTDGKGVPSGTTLESIHLANLSNVASLVTATSTVHSVLAAGASYWLVATYGAADTSIGWLANTTGQFGHSAYRPDTTSAIGSWVAGPSYGDAGYAVFGTDMGTNGVSSVDAPPSGMLVGIGCLGVISGHLFGRRKTSAGMLGN